MEVKIGFISHLKEGGLTIEVRQGKLSGSGKIMRSDFASKPREETEPTSS